MDKNLLKKYAMLAVNTGVNIKKDNILVITSPFPSIVHSKLYSFNNFLASNPYYQELMSKGAVLIIGPNITNLIGEECVYCANYEEMNELGILRKSEEETLWMIF